MSRFEKDLDDITKHANWIREQLKWLKNVEYELDKTESVQVSGGGIHRPTETIAMDYTDDAGHTLNLYERRRRLVLAVEAQIREARGVLKGCVRMLNEEKVDRRLFPRSIIEPIDQRLENYWENQKKRTDNKRDIRQNIIPAKARRTERGEGWGGS